MRPNWLTQLLAPPEPDVTQRGYVVVQLHYILLFSIGATLSFLALQLLLGTGGATSQLWSSAVCLAEIVLFCLLRLKQDRTVAIGFLGLTYVGLLTALFLNGGLQNMAIFATPLLLILCSALLGSHETLVYGALWVMGFGALFVAENLHLLPKMPPQPTSINALMIVAISTVLIVYYLQHIIKQIVKHTRRIEQQMERLELSNEVSQRMNSSLQMRTQEISTLSEYLETTQRQLVEAEKMAALGSLVAGVAHEINTPIGVGVTAATTLVLETEQMRKEYEGGGLKRSVLEEYLDTATKSSQMIATNLQRAAELVQSFKQVAVDQTSMEQRVFSVKKYLTEVTRSLEPMLKRHHHVIVVIGDDAIRLNSFPGDLAQIITNLVMNSVIHGYAEGESGHLQLMFQADESKLRIEYRDDGRGIESEHLSKIFEPFFTTARNRGGTGLGLHIVYNLVTQKMMGTIRCESSVGQGVRFIIKLPLALESADIPLETTEFEAMIKISA